MRSRNIVLLLLIAGLAVVFGRSPALAGAATDVVRGMLEKAISIQTDPGLQGPQSRTARRSEIKKVILGSFNFDEMAPATLGASWNSLDKAKQAEFRSVFQDLFLDSYSRMVLDFLGKEKITYAGEDGGPNGTTVKTVIQRTNEEIPVDYYLNQAEGGLKVKDVSIDGVSIVGNYRNSFSRIIKQESFDSLLKKMKLQRQVMEKT